MDYKSVCIPSVITVSNTYQNPIKKFTFDKQNGKISAAKNIQPFKK